MARNEKTSKRVASKALNIIRNKSVAGSALTQMAMTEKQDRTTKSVTAPAFRRSFRSKRTSSVVNKKTPYAGILESLKEIENGGGTRCKNFEEMRKQIGV